MGKKIFVSYKHGDSHVYGINRTARDYVDYLVKNLLEDEIYKGEGDEDLSEFKDETIQTHLKDKIHDSSITLVLVSPGMKEHGTREKDQWIPWEVSYSLKEITRGGKISHTNGIIAVALPNLNNSYGYYIEDDTCPRCHCRTLKTDFLFGILSKNIFNIKKPTYNGCPHHKVFTGESSYILSVKWKDFIEDIDTYIDRATGIRDNRKAYDITKEIDDDW